jgi:predicted MFS family arabinose efflux permease
LSTADLRSIRRRFYLLLAFRFIPTGLFITVFVLLMLERGLSLAQIGLGTAAQGVVMLFLELPSGGLADALGRKPVLVVASLFSIAATSLLLVADTVLLLACVAALLGVFRALDSGPLESWFIDASLVADPAVDIEGGLARQNVVICISLGFGAMVSGAIAATDGVFGINPLAVPIALGLLVQIVGLVALVTLMHEVRVGEGWEAARRSIATVPSVVHEAVRIIRGSALLTALVFAELLWGFGMIAFETFFPPRLTQLGGGVEEAARILGPAITFGWILSGVGAACSPWLVRRFGSGVAGCTLRFVQGATVVGMGLAAGPAGLVIAYLATYWAHGATAPVHYGMVHRAVESSHRATIVSANSLTSQVGGAVSGILLGALADATSISTAMYVAGAVLAAAGPLYLVGRSTPAVDVVPETADPVPVP